MKNCMYVCVCVCVNKITCFGNDYGLVIGLCLDKCQLEAIYDPWCGLEFTLKSVSSKRSGVFQLWVSFKCIMYFRCLFLQMC